MTPTQFLACLLAVVFPLFAGKLDAKDDEKDVWIWTSAGPRWTNVWSISRERLSKQPQWDPVGQEAPISPHKAVQIGLSWLQQRGVPTNEVHLTNISLQQRAENLWCYSFYPVSKPDPFLDRVRRKSSTWLLEPGISPIFVLMDGAVVEPHAPGPDEKVDTVRRIPFTRSDDSTNVTATAKKRIFERATSKVIKVFSIDDFGVKYRAYLVKWRDHEVIACDPVARTKAKEGDLIDIMASESLSTNLVFSVMGDVVNTNSPPQKPPLKHGD